MKRTTTNIITVLLGVTTSLIAIALDPNPEIYAQNENKTSEVDVSNATAPAGGALKSTPGEKIFYIFTSEVENVDENKLKVVGDSYSINTLVVDKGDNVTVNFYNVDDVQTERHSFTIDEPYHVNIDVGFAENGNATFTAGLTGVFTYYCKYHLPVMTGQLVVLP